MALTDVITDELLKALETDTDPETVLTRYRGSKGPLYGALARATRDATTRYATLQQRVTRARTRATASEHRAQEADARAGRAEDAAQAAEQRLAAMQATLAQHQGTVQQVKTLTTAGWTTDTLATLTTIFTRGTAESGQPASEAVARFLATHRIGGVVEGEVSAFTSHGALIVVVLDDGQRVECYAPTTLLGTPAPARARDVVARGDRRRFRLVRVDDERRIAEVALA